MLALHAIVTVAAAAAKQQLACSQGTGLDALPAPELQPPDMWGRTWMAVRAVWLYQAAAFMPPLVTAAILPLILSPQMQQVGCCTRHSIPRVPTRTTLHPLHIIMV